MGQVFQENSLGETVHLSSAFYFFPSELKKDCKTRLTSIITYFDINYMHSFLFFEIKDRKKCIDQNKMYDTLLLLHLARMIFKITFIRRKEF